jgi:hypothetical protein
MSAPRKGRDTEREEGAAQAVCRALRGSYEINDTGAEPSQFDVRITAEDGRSIALEVTSFGGDVWRRTRARIESERLRGNLSGEHLVHQWWVVVPSGVGIRDLQPGLDEVLAQLEREGRTSATSRYEGDDEVLREAADVLRELRVNSVSVWDESPPEEQPRILISQSERTIGTSGALPAALTAVFDKGDNQEKLAQADCDERHLYVFMENGGAGVVLDDQWPLPGCPPDPAGVIDVVWVYSPARSAYLFETRPGSAEWSRFIMATGDPAAA